MEEASRVELIKDIEYKLIELCQIDMCILVLANHFMLYMNNIQVFDEQGNGYVDTVVTGLYTRWAELYKMYQEEVWGQDAQWEKGFDRLRELNEE